MEHIIKLAVKLGRREVSNFKDLEDETARLMEKLELLNNRKMDVLDELQVEESDIRGKKRKREVANWLKIVGEKKVECEELIGDACQCLLYSRGSLTTRVVQKRNEVTELVEQSRFFQGLVTDTLEIEKVSLGTSITLGHAFENNLKNLWACMMDDNVSCIGIYGMGGVGKTTLAMRVHDNLLPESKFSNHVYWITVSQEYTLYKLQKDISKAMNIGISDEDDERKRAGILRGALKKRKNFLLIFDDVWKGFDVEKLGVPQEGLKLLVTSRSEQVCRIMGCEKVIKLDVLSEPEAWELFQEKLKFLPTTPLKLAPETTKIAQKIVKRCGGLPLGIITMAQSMRGVTDIFDWRNTLAILEESFKRLNSIEDEVFPILLYSFNRLENPTLQMCFLYCALYPEDHEMPRDELVRKFIIEELMDKRSSRREELDQGYAILNKLEDVCLLVGSSGTRCVKMHDLVRDMALRITRKNPRFMVKSGLQLQEIPSENEWVHDLDKVSLMFNRISIIPTGMSPKCPILSSLNLNHNNLCSIPDSFFEHLLSLRTLDLSSTNIQRLPDSVSLLVTLKALILKDCRNLVLLPSLEKLKALTELDLSKTCIKEAIHGLESLTNLECLEFTSISMNILPSGTLRRLSRLQCLTLPFTEFLKVEDVLGLRHLEEFQGKFINIDEFKQFIVSRYSHSNPSSYFVYVGEFSSNSYMSKTEHGVAINDKELAEIALDDEIVLPLWDLQTLYIMKAKDTKCILRILPVKELKSWSPLEKLEYLYLLDLPKLVNIIEWEGGAVPPSTFSSLRKLILDAIHGMKKLLPRGLLDNLTNLELLEVNECDKMEEIIWVDERETDLGTTSPNHVIILPNLRELSLKRLPELRSIWKSTILCNSIKIIEIRRCRKLTKLALFPLVNGQPFSPPVLEKIQMSTQDARWWDSLEWEHPDYRSFLHPFLKF